MAARPPRRYRLAEAAVAERMVAVRGACEEGVEVGVVASRVWEWCGGLVAEKGGAAVKRWWEEEGGGGEDSVGPGGEGPYPVVPQSS